MCGLVGQAQGACGQVTVTLTLSAYLAYRSACTTGGLPGFGGVDLGAGRERHGEAHCRKGGQARQRPREGGEGLGEESISPTTDNGCCDLALMHVPAVQRCAHATAAFLSFFSVTPVALEPRGESSQPFTDITRAAVRQTW
jgi:hypothetical protein